MASRNVPMQRLGSSASTDDDDDVEEQQSSARTTSGMPKSRFEGALSFAFFGFTSFGGPLSHVAMMQQKYVEKLKWLTAPQFTGPSSTQLVGAIAATLGGGGIAAGCVALAFFMIPAMIVMSAIGILAVRFASDIAALRRDAPYFNAFVGGVTSAAIGTIFVAVSKLTRKVVKNDMMALLVLIPAAFTILYRAVWTFPLLILGCGCVTAGVAMWKERRQVAATQHQRLDESGSTSSASAVAATTTTPTNPSASAAHQSMPEVVSRSAAVICVGIFITLLVVLPLGAHFLQYPWLIYASVFYRIGSLVYGGGHVVLPMILVELVENGLLAQDQFMDAFTMSQIMPGPMFNLSAYIGGALDGVVGAVTCWICLSLPGLLLIFAVLHFWRVVRVYPLVLHALDGFNAGACGLIVASVVLLWMEVVGVSQTFGCVCLVGAGIMLIWDLAVPWIILAGAALAPLIYLVFGAK